MAAVALGERSINAAPTPPRRGLRGKAALGGYRGAPSVRVTDAENAMRTPPSTRGAVDSPGSAGVGMARFDSLQDLLQQAGYKETRVFTPISTAHVHGHGQGSPPGGSSARETLKHKASTLGRKAGSVQDAADAARRNTSSMGKAAGAWFAAVWGATTAAAPKEPEAMAAAAAPAVAALTSALAGTATTPPPATSADALKSVQQSLATRSSRGELRQAASSPPTTAIIHDPAPSASSNANTSAASSSPILARTAGARSSPRRVHVAGSTSPGRSPRKRLVAAHSRRSGTTSGSPTNSAGRNSLWSASLRYRAANNAAGGRTATSFKSVPARGAVLSATQTQGVRTKGKMRRSLVDAFGALGDSPTKPDADDQEHNAADGEEQTEGDAVKSSSDVAEMRRLRRERREWRESISSLKAFAASSSTTSTKDKAPSSLSRSTSPADDGSPTKPRKAATPALSDLFARAAAPLVSRDDAVVLRSADCLWPAGGTGLRRMRSVEALERAAASMRTIGIANGSIDATVALANGASPPLDNPKSPEIVRSPPALMLTSPTGQSGAQLIDLGAKEFEPRSLSPEQLRAISIGRAPSSKVKGRSMIPKKSSGIFRVATAAEGEEGDASSVGSGSTSGKRGRKRMPKAAFSDVDTAATVASAEPSLMAPRPARQRGRKQRNRSKSSASSSSSAEESSAAATKEAVAAATSATGSQRINALHQQPRPAQNVQDDPFSVAPSAATAPAAAVSTSRGNVQRNAAKARRAAEAQAQAQAPTTLSRSSGRAALAKAASSAHAQPQQAVTMSPETVRAAWAATDSPSAALAKRTKSRSEHSRIPVASP